MNIIAEIVTGAVTEWDRIEAVIDAAFAKVRAALPASAAPNLAQTQSDLKQGASDALSTVLSAEATYAPALTKLVENGADAALAAMTGGLSQPLNPLLNAGVDKIVSTATAALQAWAVEAKAAAAPAVTSTAVPTAG